MLVRVKKAWRTTLYGLSRIHIDLMEALFPSGHRDQMIADLDRKYDRTPIESSHMNELLGRKKEVRHAAS